MTEAERTKVSKFLSLILRHRPQIVGIELDAAGWVDVDGLLARCAERGKAIEREVLDEVVAKCAKRRFAFSDDRTRIRANQGHSVTVDLGYQEAKPPARLYHGTVAKYIASIRRDGLRRMRRHHVHLSADKKTATAVGSRRGAPVILVVRTEKMLLADHRFYLAHNGVWLTEHVPVQFIEFPSLDLG